MSKCTVHGQRSLAGYRLWGRKESDTAEHTCAHTHTHTHTEYTEECVNEITVENGYFSHFPLTSFLEGDLCKTQTLCLT